MSDRFDDRLSGIGGPREMDPSFRDRLERTLSDAPGEDAPEQRWTFDGPRPMRPEFRSRLETIVVRGKAPRRWNRLIAAGVAAALVAGAVMFVNDRSGPPTGFKADPFLPGQDPSRPRIDRVAPNGPDTLKGFASEREFLRYVRSEATSLVGANGYMGGPLLIVPSRGRDVPIGAPPAPASGGVTAGGSFYSPADVAHSDTNIQEAGVDEPDIVKTDGRRLVTLIGGKLSVLEISAGRARLRGSLTVGSDQPYFGNPTGLFLDGDRVIVLTGLFNAPRAASRATHATNRAWTKVAIIDISNPARPRIGSSFEIEGDFVAARLANGVVRLIVQSSALGPALVYPRTYTKAEIATTETKNKQAVLRSSVGDWVPHFVIERRGRPAVTGHVHGWEEVSRPPGRGGVGMLTILTIDPADPRPDNAVSIVGSGETVYASPDNLYVTTSRLDDIRARALRAAPKQPVTRIHKFDISDPKRAVYVGSGEVPGFLLNQFSLSERDGFLRVASTLEASWMSPGPLASESSVTVFAERSGRLVPVGTVGHLGRGERIYSVRFVGAFGYVVTFRQIDPLFVIDLRKPTAPRVRGKLHMQGVSEYLHPISDTLLLGVGQAATAQGAVRGIQVSLFDVSNPDEPKRLSVKTAGAYGYTPVGQDHHSFLYWSPERLTVFPVTLEDADHTPFIGALAVRVSRSGGLVILHRLTHAGRPHVGQELPGISRSIVIGDGLFTISDVGVLVSDLGSLADRSWTPFS